MNERPFYLLAFLLALIALITHSVARGFLEDSMHRHVVRIEQAQKQQIAYTPDPLALQSSRTYNTLTIAGVVFTALSLVCMVTAFLRREHGWYLILILLLFADLAAPMLL